MRNTASLHSWPLFWSLFGLFKICKLRSDCYLHMGLYYGWPSTRVLLCFYFQGIWEEIKKHDDIWEFSHRICTDIDEKSGFGSHAESDVSWSRTTKYWDSHITFERPVFKVDLRQYSNNHYMYVYVFCCFFYVYDSWGSSISIFMSIQTKWDEE